MHLCIFPFVNYAGLGSRERTRIHRKPLVCRENLTAFKPSEVYDCALAWGCLQCLQHFPPPVGFAYLEGIAPYRFHKNYGYFPCSLSMAPSRALTPLELRSKSQGGHSQRTACQTSRHMEGRDGSYDKGWWASMRAT